MAAFAFARLVFLSCVASGRGVLTERFLTSTAASLDSASLAEAVVHAAMNNSNAFVLLDRKKRNFVAAMLAKITRALREPDTGAAEETTDDFNKIATNCALGPGLGSGGLVLDGVNFFRNINLCSTDQACVTRNIFYIIGKVLGWAADIANIEQSCGSPFLEKLHDCSSTESFGLGTPKEKNLYSTAARMVGTALALSGALWGAIVQCKSLAGGENLAPGTDWAYLAVNLVAAVKSSIDLDLKKDEAEVCVSTMTIANTITAAVGSVFDLIGQMKFDDANTQAGGKSWCVGTIMATASEAPAFASAYCGYYACKGGGFSEKPLVSDLPTAA